MKFLRRNYLTILLGLVLLVGYFSLRLASLTKQPIFADEAIYIRWAQVMRSEPTLRFLPVSDGKTPLFMWAMMPLFKVFKDPLFAGRFLSVLSGLVTIGTAFAIGLKFFNKRVALLAVFLLTVTPLIVFFDRMALVDSLLSGFNLLSLLLALLLVRFPRVDLAMLLGYSYGAGILTKTPGMFSMIVLPTTLTIFPWQTQNRQWQLVKLVLLWLLALGIAMAMYNILRLGPGFSSLSSRNQDYIHSPLRLLQYPFDPFLPHFNDLVTWAPQLLTLPIILGILGAFVWALVKFNRLVLAIILWGLLPLLAEMALLKTFTARYILFSFPPFLIAMAWLLDQILQVTKKSVLTTGLLVLLIVGFVANFDFRLVKDPLHVPLPKEERLGYLEDWTAGYGLSEIAHFLSQQAVSQPIVVGTEGSFGTLPDGLYIYLDKVPNISIAPGKGFIPDELYQSAKDHPTYFVGNKSRLPGYIESVTLLKTYPKIDVDGLHDAIILYQVHPRPATASAQEKK